MPIGTPIERYAQSLSIQGASTTFSPTGTIAVGSFVVIACTSSVTGKVPSSVSDDATGNSWSVDVTYSPSFNLSVSFASCQIATQLISSNIITINWAVASNNQVHIWLQQISGIMGSLAFDQTASNLSTGATTITTGASPTLAQADEIVFGCVRSEDLTGWAKGASYTDATTPMLGAPLSALEYKIVADTAGVTADGTQTSATANWVVALATYKGAGTAQSPTIPKAVSSGVKWR